MPEPVVIPRADHSISRRDIDPDALRVLYRLHEHKYSAYLVGGSVRDLLLGRRPKDFDIGTDAHPYQIKKLFRNCWIIGRRFRLAHVKFGPKTIEVATFRRNVPETTAEASEEPVVVATAAPDSAEGPAIVHRDNTFGTAEEDAFRRDFTVNGLFYDIATFSIIDYVGGLGDLERRVLRSIGDPRVRFVEDPVRMFRAAVLGARLGFDMDPLVVEAIAEHRLLIQQASPSRLIEEYFKILRSGYAEASFRALGRVRLLELMTPEMASPPDALWDSLARLDAYRRRVPAAPPELTNAILIGALLAPLGLMNRPADLPAGAEHDDRVSFGTLPVARKDIDRLRHLLQIVPKLVETELPPRLARSLPHRPSFPDARVWLEIFGDAPEAVERWRHVKVERPPAHGPRHPHGQKQGPQAAERAPHPEGAAAEVPHRRRRRRRRRGRRRGGGQGGGPTAAT